MSKTERVMNVIAGILFACMGVGGLIIVGAVLYQADIWRYWPVLLVTVPIGLLMAITCFAAAGEALYTFRTGRL